MTGPGASRFGRDLADVVDLVSAANSGNGNGHGAGVVRDPSSDAAGYEERPDGIWYTGGGNRQRSEHKVANFTARIEEVVTRDDGFEKCQTYIVQATHDCRTCRGEVPRSGFPNVQDWASKLLGPTAYVLPGRSNADHAHVAIREFSRRDSPEGVIPERLLYSHTGWRKLGGGEWVFLHAGGAIGGEGAVPNVEVDLGARSTFDLGAPVEGNQLREAVRASLAVLDVGPASVTAAVLGATYRAPFGANRLALHLVGGSGALKSSVAAVAQAHYGATFAHDSLPLHWYDSAGAILADLAALADVLVVIDDLAPRTDRMGAGAQLRTADEVLRSAVNGAPRKRLRQDGSPRPVKGPRGLILSTGEKTPAGHSLLGRTVVVDVERNVIDLDRLAEAQRAAREGKLSQAMAGYIRWMAADREERLERKPEAVRRFEEKNPQGVHLRSRPQVAELWAGWECFLDFAEDCGAVGGGERSELETRALHALAEVLDAQAAHVAPSEPATRYVEFLRSALQQGKCYLAPLAGASLPRGYGQYGWRRGAQGPEPAGRTQIGWIPDNAEGEEGYVYLEPIAALGAVKELAERSGEGFDLDDRAARRALGESGLIRPTKVERRRTWADRRIIDGERISVLVVRLFDRRDRDPGEREAF